MGKEMFERRFNKIEKIEFRMDEETGEQIIEGYASPFMKASNEMFGVVEFVEPGAFTKTISEYDQRALHNHNTDLVLGRRSAGTLGLTEDDYGLRVQIRLPKTSYANDLVISAKRGDIKEMSIGFDIIRDRWEHESEGGTAKRYLVEVRLYEVSTVAFPAYNDAVFSLRSFQGMLEKATKAGEDFRNIVLSNGGEFAEPVQENHPAKDEAVFNIEQAKRWLDFYELSS